MSRDRAAPSSARGAGPGGEAGFTLVEVLVALMIVAMGLAALMTAVSGTARTSGYLRDKTLAEWIALNRLSEVRLNLNKFAQNTDIGEVYMANRTWHYDTRYFDTSVNTMKRVVVRVYAGDSKTKGNPVGNATGFVGTSLTPPGNSNAVDWTQGMTAGGQSTNPPTNGGTGITSVVPNVLPPPPPVQPPSDPLENP